MKLVIKLGTVHCSVGCWGGRVFGEVMVVIEMVAKAKDGTMVR